MLFGGVTLGLIGVVAGRLVRAAQGGLWNWRRWRRDQVEWFLVSWLCLEIAGYFAMTPFAAVRRIMGITLVATILLARLASRSCRTESRSRLVRWVTVAAMVLGMLYYGIDFREAAVREQAAEEAAAYLENAKTPHSTIWYAGHWGFQYYAERMGMQPLQPGRTQLQPDDWVVLPDARQNQQWVHLRPECVRLVERLAWGDYLPVRTVQCFYGTVTGVPLEHHEGPRIEVRIYRVIRPCTADRG
jgi:hypothetical protein